MSSARENAPLALHVVDDDDDDDFIANHEKRSFADDDDHSSPLLPADDSVAPFAPSKPSKLPRLIICLAFALALLSAVNIGLLPVTLSRFRAHPLSDSEVDALPYGDFCLGLDQTAKTMPSSRLYDHAWPDRIARVSRKLKNAVWGEGLQVYITVQDSTIMRFPVPVTGMNACAFSWQPPPEFSARAKGLTTKGDVTEIEIWQLIAPSATSTTASATMDELNYDALSYSTLPVRGELLGVLDLTVKPNSTTLDFACPSNTDSLLVEMTCQRVACHVSFMQLDMAPSFGFSLVRKKE